MTTYAIGDLQGCLDPLRRLLDKLKFDPGRDRLWFTGDLVNRGPDSLQCLRFVSGLGEHAVTVLGNHDLHLLAVSCGVRDKAAPELDAVLKAPDADALLHWLRHRPLLHHDAQLNFTMVHAGLPPQWNIQHAVALAQEVETVLRSPEHGAFFADMYGARPDLWSNQLMGIERARYIVNALTRIRFVDHEGRLDFRQKGPPGSQPHTLIPWFSHPDRQSRGARVITGHWSALGAYCDADVFSIDGGCVWGNELVALRLADKPELIRVSCPGGA